MKNKILFVVSLIIITSVNYVLADDFPKTRLEREQEEMGSVVGGEGLLFRPGKIRNTSTQSSIGNVNKYLYEASMNFLKNVPLNSSDSAGGTIITEWYQPDDYVNSKPEKEFKVTVYIKDDVISVEAIDVVAFERSKINGMWSSPKKSINFGAEIEEKIIRNARELYLESTK